jgi:hypothetical protein
MPHSLKCIASVCLLVSLSACDRRREPFVPADQEPPRIDHPIRVPGLESQLPRASMPLGAAASDEPTGQRTGVASDGAPIRGTVTAGDGVTARGDGVLFVIARNAGAAGPPLAVKRLAVGPFPLAFEIGPDDEMIKGRPFIGPISLVARVDRDGNPMTRDPADPSAELAEPVQPGASDVVLKLELPH